MKKVLILSVIMSLSWFLAGQSLLITFTGIDETVVITSVQATNLSTWETTSLPGNETLLLHPASGIDVINPDVNNIRIFPNPVENTSNLILQKAKAGKISIEIQTVMGQTVISKDVFLEAGSHRFSLSPGLAGLYIINCRSEEYKSSIYAICTISNKTVPSLIYNGSTQMETGQNPVNSKGMNIVAQLSYTPGDVIHYKCTSETFTTIFTDAPTISKTYTVEFFDCTDASNMTYEIAKIDNQFWMAENLAYLPLVNNPYEESYTDPRYYVYGYDGNLVSEAKATYNYEDYGALYNWEAAKISCPDGWHLPSEAEWNTLVDYLGSEPGTKLKSYWGWIENGSGNNHSGFNAFPSGRMSSNEFKDLEKAASFWSSTPEGAFNAKGKSLHYSYNVVANLFSGIRVANSVRCIKD